MNDIWKINTFNRILFSTCQMWSFHEMYSSKITPKNFTKLFCSISLLLITNSDIFKGWSSLVEGLWKVLLFHVISWFFVFLTFNDNLLVLNQWLTLINCLFTVWKSVLMSLWGSKRLLVPAKTIESKG